MAARWLLITLRILSIFMLVILLIEVGLIYNSTIFNFQTILVVLGNLRDLVSYGLFLGLYYAFYGFYYLIGAIFSPLGSLNLWDWIFYNNFMQSMFNNIIGRWFYFPNLSTTTPNVSEVLTAITKLTSSMASTLYVAILQILMLVLLFFAIRGSLINDPGDCIKTVVILNVLMIIPMFFISLNHFLTSFGVTTPTFIANILAENLLKPAISALISDQFVTFITSPIFIVAMLSFVYLEIVFQVSYVDEVTAPSIEREARLKSQIRVLKVEADRAIATIKQMEENKKEEQKLKLAQETAAVPSEGEDEKKLSLRSFMSETGKGRFSYVAELIEKKKLEKEEKMRMGAMKDTRRLANYLDKLFRQDPDAYSTLTAKSSSPSATNLISSTIINLASRIVIITVLAWICIHPYFIFVNVFQTPAAISQSIEISTPEAVLSIFIPIVLIIPLMSTIIRIAKHNKLNETLRLEAIQRSGMTEAELNKLLEKPKKKKGTEQEKEIGLEVEATKAEPAATAPDLDDPTKSVKLG